MMSNLFRQGYRDALMGDEWIRENMPSPYYDGVAKAKRTRKAAKTMPDKSAVMWLLMDHGLTMYQANPLADKLLALFGGDA